MRLAKRRNSVVEAGTGSTGIVWQAAGGVGDSNKATSVIVIDA
jgi:hypothetical protein